VIDMFLEERWSKVFIYTQGVQQFPDGWYEITSEYGPSYYVAGTPAASISATADRSVVPRDTAKRIRVPAGHTLSVIAAAGATVTVTRFKRPNTGA